MNLRAFVVTFALCTVCAELAGQAITPEDKTRWIGYLDSTNTALVMQALSEIEKNQVVEAIPSLESNIWKQFPDNQYYFLRVMWKLRSPNVLGFARAFIDTCGKLGFMAKPSIADSLQFKVDATEILIDLGDYSTVSSVFQILQRDSSTAYPRAVRLLKYLVLKVPTLAANAKSQLLRVALGDSRRLTRWSALSDLVQLYGDESSDALLQATRTDSDGSNRIYALNKLVSLGYQLIKPLLYERLRDEREASYRGLIVDTLLTRYGTIQDYEIVRNYQTWEQDSLERSLSAKLLSEFTPPKPSPTLPTSQLLDSLDSCLYQAAGLGWLGDNSLVTKLGGELNSARTNLLSGDPASCARRIRDFQKSVDDVYGGHAGNNSHTIRVEGWKFLYYNAQYILDRLPPIPASPVIASLNPSTAYAGGNGFSQNVRGKAFVATSVVLWNGSSRTTSFVADSVLQATILASDIASPGTASVAVVNPGYDTSNVLPFTVTQAASGLSVKLVNSAGTNLTGGSLQYYDASWKDATNNNDGTFKVNTTLATVSLRMTYEGGSQTKSNVAVGPNVVVFQTVNTQVKLQNSTGALIDTGSVQYYFSSWQNLGTTTNGVARKELLPGNYTFRMTYATATNDKQQDIGTNPTVVFTTVNAIVQLKNSQGNLIDQGTVQYYFSSWQALGHTVNGVATAELLPANYTFRMSYAFATNDKQQNIGTNPTVVFSTVNAIVQLKNSQGAFMDQGTVQYYFSSWQNLGTTTNGVAAKELLPGNYTFRMTHETVTNDKVQNISTNGTVSFSTVLCTVRVRNSQSQPVDGALISYYFSSWRSIGATVGGQVTKELLPANLTFRETIGSATQNKVQNIGTNALVEFSVQ